jgi:transposase
MKGCTFIGLDVHRATISVSIAQGERGGEFRHWGSFPHRPDHIRKLVEWLADGGARLHFCHEAGPCGFGLHRQLTELGHDCMVVAPSLIPMEAGDRVKTDRRDATMLAKLHRAGELTAVWVPDAAHEAMRDLVRARATAVRVAGKARQHLQGFLLRHGRIYPGKKGWTKAYRRWLTTVRFMHPAQQIEMKDYIHAVTDAKARIERLTKQMADLLPGWSLAPVVEAVQAMRGFGMGLGPVAAPCLTLHRGGDGDGRGRQLQPVRQPTATDGLSATDAVGAFQRCKCLAGRIRDLC